MPTWQEIGRNNFQAAVSLYDDGYYRSSTSRFYSVQDANASELAPYPCLSDSSGRLSGHFPAAACRCALSDTAQLCCDV